ncbi:MAG: PIN domain-containing protein [Chitinophagaceae bacterium]|nr:MAG: PIN domain-containing protein [Chitinophagaceae bacterium]
MIHSWRLTELLDANVLYPAPVRDILLHLASLDLYKPKWSSEIQDEWIRNLLMKRPDLTDESLQKTKSAMNSAFPDADVDDFESLIQGIQLPDEDDRHVVAAAIKGRVDVIVTSNLKDFPEAELSKYELEVQSPDEFISNLINLDRKICLKALENQVKSLTNPPKTREEVLETLTTCGLTRTVDLLKET